MSSSCRSGSSLDTIQVDMFVCFSKFQNKTKQNPLQVVRRKVGRVDSKVRKTSDDSDWQIGARRQENREEVSKIP